MSGLTTRALLLFSFGLFCEAAKSNLIYYTSKGGFSSELMLCTVKMLDQLATDAEFELTTGQCEPNPQSSSNVSSYIVLQTYEPHFPQAMDTTVDVLASINTNYPVVFEVRVPNPGVGDMMLFEFNGTSGVWLIVRTEFDGLYINTTTDVGTGTSNHKITNNTLAGSDVIVQISFIFSGGVVQVFLDTTHLTNVIAPYQQQLKARFNSNFATCNRILYIWKVQRLNYI